MGNPFGSIRWTKNSWTGTGINSFKSSSMGDVNWKIADYFKGTKGTKRVADHAWNTSKDLIRSIKENPETYVETPTSNRWVGKDGSEYLTPKTGMERIQLPSTCIESIIVDKKVSRDGNYGTQYKVSISYVNNSKKYYDYWASEGDIEDLMKAPSKGREVTRDWNGHWEGPKGQKKWITNPIHYYD